MNKTKKIAIIASIIIFALFIRLYKLDSPFCSNDHTTIQMFTIDSFPNSLESLLNIDNYGIGNPLRIIASIYSITLPAYMFTYLNIYNIFEIPITESTLKFPMIIIGLISLIFVYKLSRQFTSTKNSLIITAMIALLPGHIAWSKDISNSLMIALLGQLASILFFTRYLEKDNNKDALLASIAIAFTILSENTFPQFIALLIYIYVVYEQRSLFNSIKKIMRPQLSLLPILAILIHIVVFITIITIGNDSIGTNAGAIGHILEKEKFIGLNITQFFDGLKDNTTIAIAAIISIFTLIGFTKIFTFKKENILLAAGLAYAIPLIIFIDPKNIDFLVYSFTSAIYLTIYSFIKILDSKRIISNIIVTLAILSIIITGTLAQINNQTFLGFGKQYNECGTKTAGYYFREYTDENSTVLTISDGEGKGTVGPIIGKYYFHRQTYGLFNHNNEKYIEMIEKDKDNIDYIITKPNDKIENYISENGYYKNAIIRDKEDTLLIIYSKNKSKNNNTITLDANNYNTEYSKRYNKITDYIRSPSYIADSPAWI